MKKFRFFIFFSLIICCLLAFIGCGKTKLERPTNLQIDQDTLVLTWDEVENARYYTISINGENDDSSKNSYSLSKLDAGEYTIKVRANSSGKDRSTSKWSVAVPFVREQEPGMIFKLINDGTEYEVANVGTAEGDIVVPSTYRNRPVTSIGRRAFAGKPKVTSVVLPESITNIGEQAFNKCSYLKTINIPDGVKTIGAKAFQSCSVLESEIVIPAGVTELADGVFNYCYSIPKITIGANVKTIGEFTFANCTAITEIVIPDSVKAIGLSSFSDCTLVSSLTMGTGLVSIGDEAFSGCGSLTSVVIPENVESIGAGAFYGCTNIESVSMSDKVLSIGAEAFKGCTKLAEVDLSSNMQSIGYNAFLNTKIWEDETNLVYVGNWLVDSKDKKAATYDVKDGTVGIAVGAMAFLEVASQIVLPDSVKIIDMQAFYYCKELTTMEIGSGVEVIRLRAFGDNEKLSNVILGKYDWDKDGGKGGLGESSLKRIEQYAFMGCKVLTSIDIPDTVEFIGGYAFRKTGLAVDNVVIYADDWLVGYDDMSMTFAVMFGGISLEVKEGTRGIAEYALYKGTGVVSLTLPNSVEIINKGAFMDASSLNSVVLPNNLKRIEEYTFLNCNYLLDCELPESLEYIGTGAFRNCWILGLSVEENFIVNTEEDTLVIPANVKTIGDYAFYGCGAEVLLNEETQETDVYGADILVIGDGVTSIGKNAFANFISLQDVRLGANVETIGEKAFYKAIELKKVSFGEKVTSMGKRAFYGCTLLEEITLPNSLTEISEYAFYKCEAVKKITLGNAVTTIGKYAFYGCAALENLTIPETVTFIGKLSFRNANLVKSFVIGESVATIENYAFYNWKNVTFYVEASAAGESWAERWNASHRPVVWGVTLSEEGYVVSFTKTETSVENAFENVTVNAPERAGYTFAGWTSVQGGTTAEYTAVEIASVPVGTVLYAIWTPQVAA